MNPFELRGPAFLFFYVVLTILVFLVTRLIRRVLDGGDDAPPQETSSLVSDPYVIAHLRGGAAETLRVALLSLVDRGLIIQENGKFKTAPNAEPGHGRRPVERSILGLYVGSGDASALSSITGACDAYDAQLQRLRLLPDAPLQIRRNLLYVVVMLFLGGVAFVKIMIGLDRGRPVGFLILLGFLAVVFARGFAAPRRTAQGDGFLDSVRRLFAGLKQRKASIQPGGATADLALLAAVFGVTEVPKAVFPYGSLLYPRSDASSSSTSGCGSSSSCGGGGGCGGGGCGGCGS